MLQGKVKWYDKKKGYGFIVGPDGKDVFVHYTGFDDPSLRTLTDGQMVEYEVTQGEKGPRAIKVRAAQSSQVSV